MRTFFVDQMAMYAAYHTDARNRLTHFFGVPAIAFSLLIPLAWLGFAEVGPYTVSAATLFAAAVMIYWVLGEPVVGGLTAIFYLPFLVLADWIAGFGAGIGGTLFVILFVGGWIIQLVGHAFEGRKPALVDNFLQIFAAPTFLTAELVFALGWRQELKEQVAALTPDYLPADAPVTESLAG